VTTVIVDIGPDKVVLYRVGEGEQTSIPLPVVAHDPQQLSDFGEALGASISHVSEGEPCDGVIALEKGGCLVSYAIASAVASFCWTEVGYLEYELSDLLKDEHYERLTREVLIHKIYMAALAVHEKTEPT